MKIRWKIVAFASAIVMALPVVGGTKANAGYCDELVSVQQGYNYVTGEVHSIGDEWNTAKVCGGKVTLMYRFVPGSSRLYDKLEIKTSSSSCNHNVYLGINGQNITNTSRAKKSQTLSVTVSPWRYTSVANFTIVVGEQY